MRRFVSHISNKELDRDLELNYFGARYYQPEFPRFLSPDPVGGTPEVPISWNRYLYCRNDTISLSSNGSVVIETMSSGNFCTGTGINAMNGIGTNSKIDFDPTFSPDIDVFDSQGNFSIQSDSIIISDQSGAILNSITTIEEHRTVGIGGNNQPGDITENQIITEQNQPARAIY